MSKAIYNKILSKLEKLEEYSKNLSEIQKVNLKSFLEDFYCYAAAERFFQLSIEVMIDIGKLIIIEKNFKKPDENEEIFDILTDHKVIPASLRTSLRGIVGFRNLLVHDYEKINRKIVYLKLQKNLHDFLKFHKAVAKYLAKNV